MTQQTFTQDEVKEAAKHLDFIFKKATWGSNISSAEALEITKMFNWFHAHIKKMHDHIFELVEHIPAPEAPAPAPKASSTKKAK